MTTPTKPNPIAVLNDKARKTFAGCRVVATASLDGMEPGKVAAILKRVQDYTAFDPAGQEDGNDPYGEHDFGAFDFEGVTYFWKFDYYADTSYRTAAPDAADPSTARVLTIMRSDDY
jgi:hypothetical protein